MTGIVLLGLALRIGSARGGLWLDEAWSAVLVERTKTPLGIFLAINHDNNHILNSLWMQLWGFGASPFLLRALSIATGTLTILVAAAIGARQSPAHALIAALLFAVSPILVNYGAEARGYAPMLLAAMIMIWCVARELEAPTPGRRSAWLLAGLALLGLLSHLTILFVIAVIAAWMAWTLARRTTLDAGLAATIRLLWPTFGVCALVIAAIAAVATLSPAGIEVGSYLPFSRHEWSLAVSIMATSTLGLSAGGPWLAALLLLSIAGLTLHQSRRNAPTGPFQVVAILIFPLLFPALQIGNSGIVRYYLPAAIAILFLVTGLLATAIARRRTRIAAALGLMILTGTSLREDIAQASLLRGDPGAAIEAMRQRSPTGASVMVDTLRPSATLRVAAATAHYPLTVTIGCPARRFQSVDIDPDKTPPPTISRCGRRYDRLISRRGALLSGMGWTLYEEAGSGAVGRTD